MFKKLWIWYFLFNKRLFKEISFVLLLLSVVLITGFIKYTSTLDSGIISIALCAEDNDDEFSNMLIRDFMHDKGILHFSKIESSDIGKKLLLENKIDAVWQFKKNIPEILASSAKVSSVNSIVNIIEKEDTVVLKFSRELLFSKIFPYYSYEAYKSYVTNVAGISSIPEEKFQSYYARYINDIPLVVNKSLFGNNQEYNYLLSPLRGVLALWVLICSFAANLYFLHDRNKGTFVWIKSKNHFFLMLGINFIVVSDACILFFISILISGLFTALWTEVLSLFLFSLAVMLFSSFFAILFNKIERIACIIPAILVSNLVFTPVYINLPSLHWFSSIFPGFYYLNGFSNFSYVGKSLFYIAILFFIDFVLFILRERKS